MPSLSATLYHTSVSHHWWSGILLTGNLEKEETKNMLSGHDLRPVVSYWCKTLYHNTTVCTEVIPVVLVKQSLLSMNRTSLELVYCFSLSVRHHVMLEFVSMDGGPLVQYMHSVVRAMYIDPTYLPKYWASHKAASWLYFSGAIMMVSLCT